MSILFVGLCHCDKHKFSLLHWITATNKKMSLQQTKLVYVAKNLLNFLAFWTSFGHFSGLLCLILHFLLHLLLFFGTYIYTNFVRHSDSVRQTKVMFVTVAQWHKPKLCLSQWLIATNKSEKKFPISLLCVTKKLEKKTLKPTSIQIWISPSLLNCFG